jgi:hypothetical protein
LPDCLSPTCWELCEQRLHVEEVKIYNFGSFHGKDLQANVLMVYIEMMILCLVLLVSIKIQGVLVVFMTVYSKQIASTVAFLDDETCSGVSP